MFKKLINKIKLMIISFNSKRYLKKIRSKNKNNNPTIISNNCLAGVIYHRLGLKFNSPIINLRIDGNDYLEFVKNIKYYKHCKMIEIERGDCSYPVGKLIPNDSDHIPITIYFQHYHSFEEAEKKWYERYERVNYDNIFYIWEFYDTAYDLSLIYEFDSLQIKKAEIIHNNIPNLKNACLIDFGEPEPVAKVFGNDGLTGRLYLDKFDYVKFLNS